jgi:hypothetical protein
MDSSLWNPQIENGATRTRIVLLPPDSSSA